jgi:UDP-glucose 4-epimerase
MKNVLVVGGAGYIGSHTVKHLRRHGCRCLVADNLVYGHRDAVGEADFHPADLNDAASLDRVFRAAPIDAVIHFAAYAYVGESRLDPKKYYQNNVGGSLALLAAMLEHGVRNIVFSSTCATYGEPRYTPLDEEHPQAPINPYGRSKLMVEHILEDFRQAYGLNYMALRYFNAAGCDPEGDLGERHDPETHLIPLLLKATLGTGPPLSVFGTDYPTPDGTCIRDYIHVGDLAEAHRLAMEKLWADGESRCLNLGVGRGVSVREIIAAAEAVTGRPAPLRYAPRRPGDPAVLFANPEKAKKVLGWEAGLVDIKEIVETAWAWEKSRPEPTGRPSNRHR